MMQQLEYHQMIGDIYAKRKARNGAYSLRAFARSIDVDAGTVSRILNRRQIPSYKLALKIASALKFADAREAAFFESLKRAREVLTLRKAPPNFLFTKPRWAIEKTNAGLYSVMTHWYHTAILEFCEVKNREVTATAVARAFAITVPEAERAFAQLLGLGLLEYKGGRLQKRSAYLATTIKPKQPLPLKRISASF